LSPEINHSCWIFLDDEELYRSMAWKDDAVSWQNPSRDRWRSLSTLLGTLDN
jgi:hypothetical protein